MKSIKNIFIKLGLAKKEPNPREILKDGLYSNDIQKIRNAIDLGADLNAIIDAPRDRPLHLAVDYASEQIVMELINAGAKVELAVYAYPCKTFPLSHYADLANRPNLVKVFCEIEAGVKPKKGYSPKRF